ncbi:MAG: type II toxin-antitoxin system VapC family toxin [Firmicutes bacterium]|nr:type II toxin-antitoxin system VapC family toxin [Bacillota bacterium]
MVSGPAFIDTWGWIALGRRKDPRHAEAAECYRALGRAGERVYTSDYVLDEAITLIFRREVFAEAVRFISSITEAANSGYIIIERITPERFAAAWDLRVQLKDKVRISFTDLTSMIIMRECGARHVLTEDKHFAQVGLGFELAP